MKSLSRDMSSLAYRPCTSQRCLWVLRLMSVYRFGLLCPELSLVHDTTSRFEAASFISRLVASSVAELRKSENNETWRMKLRKEHDVRSLTKERGEERKETIVGGEKFSTNPSRWFIEKHPPAVSKSSLQDKDGSRLGNGVEWHSSASTLYAYSA